MFVFIIGIIALFLIFVYGYNFYNDRKERKEYIRQLQVVPTALSEFDSLCNPSRFFAESEMEDYKNKYFNTFTAVASTNFISIPRKCAIEYSSVKRFIDSYKDIKRLRDYNNRIFNDIKVSNENAETLYNLLASKFATPPTLDSYFTSSEKELLLKKYKNAILSIKSVYPKYKHLLTFTDYDKLLDYLNNLEEKRLSFNHTEYIPFALNSFSNFFDNVLAYPLDMQQRKAIVTDEDNCLVISSAGSGKTSTIIGKARYLLDIRKIDPSKILILTYTRKAANELVSRLDNQDVDCSTFHSLAMRILAEIENKKPSICDASLLLNSFRLLLDTNHDFLTAVLNYILHLQSLMKLEHEYDNAPDYFADRKKYGIQAPYTDYKGNVIFTRSEEEKRICTFLTELGVNFLYECPYEHTTYTRDYRQYKPDFTIFVKEKKTDCNTGEEIEVERRVYLEHFAINAEGNVPLWFGDKDPVGGWEAQNKIYRDGIAWKRAKHREHGTTLIETRSADFHSGNIFAVLQEQLRKANVPFQRIAPEELYRRLVSRSKKIESSVFKLLEQFIALVKSNNVSLQQLIDSAKSNEDNRTYSIVNDVVKPLLEAYTSSLQERGEIDFTDAINEATNYCAAQRWKRYDYILVDEFQDISVDRYNFLKFIRSQNPLTKLFCVGDDWQSIYRFAGSNMRLFYKFEEYFGFTEKCKIEKTYRFFNPLLDLSSDFIQRNPEQMKKEVKSNAPDMPKPAPPITEMPTEAVDIFGKQTPFHTSDVPKVQEWLSKYSSLFDFVDCGESSDNSSMLSNVAKIVENIPARQSIIILGRYNYDVRSLGYNLDTHDFDRNQVRIELNIAGRKIRFMSVHSAKGLEADNIILINCNEGIYGFPSLVEDDPILSYVLSDEDKFEYAEERRLFYVALTRARKHLYVLYNGDKPSPFVRELTNVLQANQSLCPVCQEGHVVVIKQGVASNGNPYTNYGCSNANAGCEYFERAFCDDEPRFVEFNRQLAQKKEEEQKRKLQTTQTETETELSKLIKELDTQSILSSYYASRFKKL